jgi:hypothetical protein
VVDATNWENAVFVFGVAPVVIENPIFAVCGVAVRLCCH